MIYFLENPLWGGAGRRAAERRRDEMNDLRETVAVAVAKLAEPAVRALLADLFDPETLSEEALDAMSASEARAMLADHAYDPDDPEGIRLNPRS